MMTARRRITTDRDRFGGYGAQPSSIRNDEVEISMPPRADRISFETTYGLQPTEKVDNPGYEDIVPERPREEVVRYSTRGAATTADIPTRRKAATGDEFMPSIRKAEKERREEQSIERTSPREHVSGKVKAALIAYMALVIVMAVAVIATGLAVGRINGKADAIAEEIAAKNAVLTAQTTAIHDLTDLTDAAVRENLADKAEANGFEHITVSVPVEMLPATQPVEYKGRTNWFDKFCDFLSNIIGG